MRRTHLRITTRRDSFCSGARDPPGWRGYRDLLVTCYEALHPNRRPNLLGVWGFVLSRAGRLSDPSDRYAVSFI